MTTTPDSRIRDDWTLPAETAAPPPTLGAIDTSTTAGKIAVMQARERGERIEARSRQSTIPNWYDVDAGELVWDWKFNDYRIAPPVLVRTALQNARDVIRNRPAVHNPDSLAMMALVSEIDKAHTITAYPSDFGTTEFKFSAGAVPPGRYRLVRDDAP